MTKTTDEELRALVRKTVAEVEGGNESTALARVSMISDALASRGLGKNCHVGKKNMSEIETVEWYAGQFVDICESKSWFAMNSFINCVNKFCPAEPKKKS